MMRNIFENFIQICEEMWEEIQNMLRMKKITVCKRNRWMDGQTDTQTNGQNEKLYGFCHVSNKLLKTL